MISIFYKFLYWFAIIGFALIKWQTLFFVTARWAEYKKHLRFKRVLLTAGILASIIAAYYAIEYTKKGLL